MDNPLDIPEVFNNAFNKVVFPEPFAPTIAVTLVKQPSLSKKLSGNTDSQSSAFSRHFPFIFSTENLYLDEKLNPVF